jgi:DNA-directed RNA polymerase II subunit RPB1
LGVPIAVATGLTIPETVTS